MAEYVYSEDPFQHIVRIRIDEPPRRYFITGGPPPLHSDFAPNISFSTWGASGGPILIAVLPEDPAGITISVSIQDPNPDDYKNERVRVAWEPQMFYTSQSIEGSDLASLEPFFLVHNVPPLFNYDIAFDASRPPEDRFYAVPAYSGPLFGFNGDGRLFMAAFGTPIQYQSVNPPL